MLPYTMQPYTASGNYLTEQAMRGSNYPFSTPNPTASPWHTVADGYYPSSQVAVVEPSSHGGVSRLFDWISNLDVVDGTLVLTGIGLTVMLVCGMVSEVFRDGVRAWKKNEKQKAKATRPNIFQRIFGGRKIPVVK